MEGRRQRSSSFIYGAATVALLGVFVSTSWLGWRMGKAGEEQIGAEVTSKSAQEILSYPHVAFPVASVRRKARREEPDGAECTSLGGPYCLTGGRERREAVEREAERAENATTVDMGAEEHDLAEEEGVIGGDLLGPEEVQRRSLRSVHSSTRRNLILENFREESVAAYWLDYEGKERFYFHLRPGKRRRVTSFVGHAFLLRRSDNLHALGAVVVLGDHDSLGQHQRELYVVLQE